MITYGGEPPSYRYQRSVPEDHTSRFGLYITLMSAACLLLAFGDTLIPWLHVVLGD